MNTASVANRFVEVAFVNTPVLGVATPIGVFSMVPPEIVNVSDTFASGSIPVTSVVRSMSAVAIFPAVAFRKPVSESIESEAIVVVASVVVPVATRFVDVAFVAVKSVTAPVVIVASVMVVVARVAEFVATKSVEVALVSTALSAVRLVKKPVTTVRRLV